MTRGCGAVLCDDDGSSSSGVGRVGHVVAPIYADGTSHCSSTIMAVISPTKVFLPLLHWKSLCRNQQLCLLVRYLLQSGAVTAASRLVWWCLEGGGRRDDAAARCGWSRPTEGVCLYPMYISRLTYSWYLCVCPWQADRLHRAYLGTMTYQRAVGYQE